MEDFALISDVQRERIIEISEGFVRQITKGKNHQILSEKYCNCTRILFLLERPYHPFPGEHQTLFPAESI